MKRNRYIFLGMALTALPAMAQHQQAQPKDTTMNRTVVVEQEYNPEIMDASKVNVLPKVEEPTVIKKEVEYAVSAVPASNIPMETMQAYTGIEAQPMSKPGYIRLGYGNYNNLDVYANYLFHLSGRDKLNVNFNMTGMSGKLEVPYGEGFKWNAHYYRTRASVDYLHQFKKVDLNVAGHFGLSNFNYEPNTMASGNQKFTSGDIHFGAKSTDETMPLQFHAETNLMLYNRRDYLSHGEITETQVRTYADVRGKINDEQQIAIGLTMNNLIYSNDAKKNAFKQYFKEKYDDRTTLNLNPYYELMDDSWHLHLGANVDGSFGGGKKLRVSPDVSIQFIFSDSYVLYAKATGGRIVNDFRRLETYDPYLEPDSKIRDTYEQVNASIGFKASPVNGLWFNLFAGYQNLKDDLYAREAEFGFLASYADIPASASRDNIVSSQTQTDNLYAGLQVSYQYKDILSLSAEGIYRHWKADDAFESYNPISYNPALLMKPETELNFQAEFHPIPNLWMNVGYQYIRRAERYHARLGTYLPSVSDLSLGITYNLFKGASIYAKADNLLNKAYQRYLLYPTEGINFVGGLSFQF